MKHNTGIEWTQIPGRIGETWNAIVGCTIVSPGCSHCYAMREAERQQRLAAGAGRETHYAGTTRPSKAGPVWTGKVALAPDHILTAPLRWAKPRAVFVNSMGDLFHEDVPDEWIDRVFAIMALCPQHVFIVLTKRAERMRHYVGRTHDQWNGNADNFADRFNAAMDWNYAWINDIDEMQWPLPNVWLGVSVEDQARADARIPHLLNTPAAIRFVSCEPLLGPVDLTRVCLAPKVPGSHRAGIHLDALAGRYWESQLPYIGEWDVSGPCPEGAPALSLDWVIAGGESGKGARPMHPDWARGLRDQCKAADVPFFFKQWGEWAPGEAFGMTCDGPVTSAKGNVRDWLHRYVVCGDDRADRLRAHSFTQHVTDLVYRVGKARAGRLLDGETHHNWPEVGA